MKNVIIITDEPIEQAMAAAMQAIKADEMRIIDVAFSTKPTGTVDPQTPKGAVRVTIKKPGRPKKEDYRSPVNEIEEEIGFDDLDNDGSI